MTLSRVDGESVRVDGAFAMRPPDHLRLRAWKLDRAVADWTITPQGVWLWQAGEEERQRHEAVRRFWSSSQVEVWPMLFGLVAPQDDDVVTEIDISSFAVHRRLADHVMTLRVRRRDLAVIEAALTGPDHQVAANVVLSDHRLIDGHIWPGRVTATMQGLSFTLECDEVSLNEAIEDAAFRPSGRAVKVR